MRLRFFLRTALSLVILAGCAKEPKIELVEGIDVCRECNMVIDQANQAAGFVSGSEFITFDSPACLLRYLEGLPKDERPPASDIYFADYRTGFFQSAELSTFLLTDHIPTVMNGRVVTFSDASGAKEAKKHPDERVMDWYGYRAERGTPDQILEVTIEGDRMVPDVVEVEKDDVVVLRAVGRELEADITLTVTGYPEAGAIIVPAAGDTVEVRFLALKPGAGFPIGPSKDRPMGMLKVVGAHTSDEEVQR